MRFGSMTDSIKLTFVSTLTRSDKQPVSQTYASLTVRHYEQYYFKMREAGIG